MRVLHAAILSLTLMAAAGPAAAELRVVSEGKAIQVQTDEIVVHSEKVGRDFLIEVTRTGAPIPGRKYPAVYALDGGFGVVGPASHMMIAGGRTPNYFVVSIGYPNPEGRHMGPRNTDLVHRTVNIDGKTYGGGGAAFEAFILEELRPYLEKRYPLDPARAVLVGHSGGAIFTATVMLNRPEAFSGYVVGSLQVIDGSPLPELAKAAAPRGAGRRVFIGFSPPDQRDLRSDALTAALTAPGSAFKVRQEVFADETHNSVYPLIVARGLPFVLPTETAELVAVRVEPAALDRYLGTYRVAPAQTLTITREGDKLFGQVSGGARQELQPASETRFFARAVNATVTFQLGADGKASGLVLRMNGSDISASRITER